MKNNIYKLILILIPLISFGGCYTILWSPEEQLPSENNNSQIYYSEPYYGDYGYYYDYPWWINEYPVYVTPAPSKSNERTPEESTFRNGEARNTPDSNRPIINTKPPSRNGDSNNNSSTVSKTNSSNNSSEQTKATDNSRSNNSSSRRNDNGSRNSGGGRR